MARFSIRKYPGDPNGHVYGEPGWLCCDYSTPALYQKTGTGTTGWVAVGGAAITDAELLAIAGLTSASDKLPYFTGSGTAALADFTAFARTLLDDPDAATALATLGTDTSSGTRVPTDGSVTAAKVNTTLKPSGTAATTDESLRRLGTGSTHAAAGDDSRFPTSGQKNALAGTAGTPGTGNEYVTTSDSRNSDARTPTAHKSSHATGGSDALTASDIGAQASDTELTAIAGLVSAANKLPYFTGAGTAGLADFTAAGRALVDDADAAAQRTTLGLGTAAVAATGDFDAAGAAAAAQAASQPVDSDLTAIAALTTTSFGRGLLALADAAAGRTAFGLGTAALAATGDFDAAGAAAAAASASQPVDGDLTAIAALTTTSFGRSVLTQANAAALRTLAGVVIGTDVQAYDAELAALAGLTSGADKLPYFTGIGTAGVTTLSTFIRTLLDDADAATALATLGTDASSASRPPNGTAGGDLAGSYPNPTIKTALNDPAAATPGLRTLGTGAAQAASGTDPRLSDSRTPTAHATSHQPGGSDAMAVDAAAATGSLRTIGTGALQAMAGNDSRVGDIEQLPLLPQAFPFMIGATVTTAVRTLTPTALGATTARVFPFVVPQRITVNQVLIETVGVVANSLILGIFDKSGTRVWTSGVLSTVAGLLAVTTNLPVTLTPGTYYFATTNNNVTSATAAYQTTPAFTAASVPRWGTVAATSGAMPASITPGGITETVGGFMAYVVLSNWTT